ncbi:MAG TPA: prolyl oligopeptidase family serine peptidase [Blastocatellia bacterium]|nr:prolyl oligopeptidase family serine peptidase [Blastocatellia bacterium]
MKKRFSVIPLIWVLVLVSVALPQAAKESSQKAQATQTAPQSPRPLEIADVASWKRVQMATVSNDGQWFAYRLVPNEGDGEVIVRRLSDNKELKFPAGEGGFAPITFSDDSKWVAFTVFPNSKETKRLRKERKPIHTKVALVNLATEKKIEFEKIRRFAFSGEQSTWIALHRTGDGPATGPPSPSPFPVPPASAASSDRASGTDLILYELSTGNQLNIGNVSEFAFDKKGNHLAFIIDAAEKTGNGIQLRNMSSGAVLPLESDKANYRSLNWNEEGTAFAALKGVEDKKYEDKLYSVVAFSDVGANTRKVSYDPKEDKSFPADMTLSPNRSPVWTDDMTGLLFGIHAAKKKKDADKAGEEKKDGDAAPDPRAAAMAAMRRDEPDKPDVVIWHHKDSRLQSQQQVQENLDKNHNYLATYRIAEKRFIRLGDDNVRRMDAAPKHKYAIGFDNSPYEYTGNLDGLRYQDVYAVDLKTGERRLAVKKARNYYGPSPDGTHILYFEEGHFYTYDMTTGRSYNITEKVPSVFYNTEDDHNISKPPRFPIGWAKGGVSVLLSDGWDIWNVPVHGGQATNLTANGKKDQVRYRTRYRIDPEEKGIDTSKPIYVGMYGEWTKKSGIARIENGKVTPLLWDDAGFGGLIKAKNADRYLYTRENFETYPDYYAADASLKEGKRLTDANPQKKNFLWSKGVKLIDYTSAKGDKLQGALFLPANYEPGKSYPTIVYIYEKLSQGLNFYTSPSVGGFNKSLYTSQGYAVFMPDIVYRVNDPGMSAAWCVLPALEAAIKTGVVDRSRVAIHGHSWGGYQTAFLVTQTDAFKAAIAGAPLTNMISMYSLIYWNTGSANQPIFESSQGRFTTGYWDNLEAYARNSPVYHAKNVKTPLIILHNDKDGAVDFTQGIEYFNTLRRLGKSVVMLQYKGENHGLAKLENRKDYSVRMLEFFDHHLKGKPAPAWLREGVPHLKIKEHLDERAKEVKERPEFDGQ